MSENKNCRRFLLYCLADKEIICVPDSDVLLGAHENLSLEDWAKEGQVNVTVSYEDDVFDAVVLQVLSGDQDCAELQDKLRCLVKRKHLRLDSLLRMVDRVKQNSRTRIAPVDTFITESDSATEEPPRKKQKVDCSSQPLPRDVFLAKLNEQAQTSSRTVLADLNSPSRQRSASPAEPSAPATLDQVVNAINVLRRTIASVQYEQKRQNDKLDRVLTILQSRKENVDAPPNFEPLVEEADFNALLSRLKEKNNQRSFVRWLSFSNGPTVEKSVSRMLNQLFSPDLQRRTNRTGRNGKLSMQSIEVYIFEAVRLKHATAEDTRVEKAVTAFFIGSRDRCGGARKRLSQERSQDPVHPAGAAAAAEAKELAQ